MNSNQVKKIQRETVRKTLALLEKKKLLNKKKLNEGNFFPDVTSTNGAQEGMLEELTEFCEGHLDDLYDYANLVAALRKMAAAVEKGGMETANETGEDFKSLVVAAMSDWKNGIKDPFNS